MFYNSTDPSAWSKPAALYYNKNIPEAYYTMTENSPVTKVLNENNMGGSVIKIVKVNNPNGMLDNYDDWLMTQESSFKITNDAIKKLGNAQ
jgi:hypothetical protein